MVHGTVSISAAATAAAVDAAHARLREQRSYHRGFDATNPVPGDPRASSDLNVAAAAWIRGQAPRDNTDCVWFKYWLPFCGARGWTPSLGATTDPPYDDAWCLFGAHLAQLRLAGTTIMTYGFALIRRFRQRFGVVPAAPRFRELLAHVKAVKIPPGGLEARDARRRTPADLRHVSAIVNDDTLDLALRAAVVAIFFSLARPQELVVGDGGYDASRHLRRCDISVFPNAITLRIKSAKRQDIYGEAVKTISALPPSSPVGWCPVELISRYLDSRRPRSGPNDPAFVSATGAPVTVADVNDLMKQTAALFGTPRVKGYSLRIGGTTAMYVAGAPDEEIRGKGGWSLEGWRRYTRPTLAFYSRDSERIVMGATPGLRVRPQSVSIPRGAAAVPRPSSRASPRHRSSSSRRHTSIRRASRRTPAPRRIPAPRRRAPKRAFPFTATDSDSDWSGHR